MARFSRLLSLLLAGCVGSSVPSPPNLDPIDPEAVHYRTQEDAGFAVIVGAPRATTPDVEVWAWVLFSSDPPIVTQSDAEGGFVIVLPTDSPTVPVRFQARLEDVRSPPVDLIAGPETSAPLERPDCFIVPLELELVDRQAELALENRCPTPVELLDTPLRATDDFVVDRPDALLFPPGARAVIRVEAPGNAATEDILFVDVALDGVSVSYPVTVIAPAR